MSGEEVDRTPVADPDEEWEDADDDEDEDDSDWESDDEVELTEETINNILEIGNNTNDLLNHDSFNQIPIKCGIVVDNPTRALLSHPQMNKSEPEKSPRPLFFATDFVMRTYLEYLLPIIPRDAIFKSSRFANPQIFQYPESSPAPTETADDYLHDPKNWSGDSSTNEMYMDAVGRHTMICLAIKDDVKGSTMLQGKFDWENPVNIKALALASLKS